MVNKKRQIGQYTTPVFLPVAFSVSGFVVTFSFSGKGDEVSGEINDSNSYRGQTKKLFTLLFARDQ